MDGVRRLPPHETSGRPQRLQIRQRDNTVARYPGYVDDFEGLERLAPDEDLPALKLLTQHEVAAIEFAGREVAGEADSAASLHRYLEQCMVWFGLQRTGGGGEGEAYARMSKGGCR
jgi:hypothetical protein